MPRLEVSRLVAVSCDWATAFIGTYFADRMHGRNDGVFEVRTPLAHTGGLRFQKDVTVHVRYERDAGPAGRHLIVHWEPRDGGPFPAFHGAIVASPEGEQEARITIGGDYAPPGGWAGAVFDILVGRRIARRTLHDLLDELAQAMEADRRERMLL